MPNASANARKSAKSAAGSGTYTASSPAAANAALCMTGDTECITLSPTTPYSAVFAPTVRNRNCSSMRAAGTWPGATPLPPYVHRDPKREASSLLGTPASPMPTTTASPPFAMSSSGSVSESRAAVTATLINAAPVLRIARARVQRSFGTPVKSWDETTTLAPFARIRSSNPARHSRSTYSAPSASALASTARRSSSLPTNPPPSRPDGT